MSNDKVVSVILPTFNEKGNIIPLIKQISQELDASGYKKEIIVVDDNSPDGTGNAVIESCGTDRGVRVIIRKTERGFATAIRHGIENSTGQIIIVMDTDFNHDPKMIPQMVKFLDHYDIISGSRFSIGGAMEPAYRYLGSYFYNFFIRLVLRTQTQDNLCGYFSIRRDKLFALPFDQIYYGYGDYFFRMLCFAQRKKYRILEVPVIYLDRQYGESKTALTSVFGKYTKAVIMFRLKKGGP